MAPMRPRSARMGQKRSGSGRTAPSAAPAEDRRTRMRPTIRRARVFATVTSAAVACAVAVVPGSVSADTGSTLYVDGASSSCSDTAQGTSVQPFCTIGAAAARVTAGQTVEVSTGTYRERVAPAASGTSTAPITFAAAPGATVTLTGQVNGFAISSLSWIVVDGFTVTSTGEYGILVSNSTHVTLSTNHGSYAGQPVSGKTKSSICLSNVRDSAVSRNVDILNS